MSKMFPGKYADETTVLWLWRKINALYVKKDGNKVLSDNNFTDADKAKLDSIEDGAGSYVLPTASSDTLGGIKIGSGLDIDENGVVSTVVNPSATLEWSQIRHTPTTLNGYGITDAATKKELNDVIEHMPSPTLHKLRFGANQIYEYDGTKDVIVPVYMGEIH